MTPSDRSYDPNDRLLTPADVANRLGLNRETVYAWMRKGIIRYVEIGLGKCRPRKRIRESELARQIHEPHVPRGKVIQSDPSCAH